MNVFIRPDFSYQHLDVYISEQHGESLWILRQHENASPRFEISHKMGILPPANTEPSFRIPQLAARALVDALSGNGFLPGETAQIRGELTATQKHLEDMRILVFKTGAGA
jgi:hypothetical protein